MTMLIFNIIPTIKLANVSRDVKATITKIIVIIAIIIVIIVIILIIVIIIIIIMMLYHLDVVCYRVLTISSEPILAP